MQKFYCPKYPYQGTNKLQANGNFIIYKFVRETEYSKSLFGISLNLPFPFLGVPTVVDDVEIGR